MRIPVIYAGGGVQTVQRPRPGSDWVARGQVADQARILAESVAQRQSVLRQNERIAQDTLSAIELDNTMRNRFSMMENSFLERTDSENFDADREAQIKEIYNEIAPQNASNELKIAFERSFNQHSSRAFDSVTTRKYKVMEDRGRIAIGQSVDNSATEYARATDEVTKRIIVKRTELEIRNAIKNNLVDAVWGENQIRGFEKLAKQKQIDLADVAADQAIMASPGQAAIDLRDKKYLPSLEPKQRQDKIEKAEAAFKVQQSERDTKIKQAEKIAHDKEERAIGDLYMQGEYTQAFIRTLDSKLLSGDEKKTWNTSIIKAAEASTKPSPTVRAAEIVKINGMITRGVDPDEINNYLVQSPDLEKADKKEYINKLNTKLRLEVDNARKSAYKIIQDTIIPKRGMMTNLLETPSETTSVMAAQMALDDWIATATEQGTKLTGREIKEKAIALGNQYQVPLSQRVMEIEAEAIKTVEELKKVKR